MILSAVVCGTIFAQDAVSAAPKDGFGSLHLGMSMEAAKVALGNDPNFAYRGDPDLSLSPSTGRPVIETRGVAFIDEGILQFTDNRLYILTLLLDDRRLDYYSLFTEFTNRYGDPDRLDPGRAEWRSGAVILSLERPLTVKYIDRALFEGVVEAGSGEASLETLTREQFLEQL